MASFAIYAVMADTVVINEALCYVQNNYHKYARANLITSVVGFYNVHINTVNSVH